MFGGNVTILNQDGRIRNVLGTYGMVFDLFDSPDGHGTEDIGGTW
jgi:hypothetical protein